MLKIAITTTSFGKEDKRALEFLKKHRFTVTQNILGRRLLRSEITGLCKDAFGIIAGTEKIDKAALRELVNLKVISRCGAGLENIDIDAAKNLGIKIYNTPDSPTQAVAELTIGLILNLLRKINMMDSSLKSGQWDKLAGNLLCGKKVGIIGFGRIGKRVAQLLKSFGCKIAYCDPFVNDKLSGIGRLPLKKLLNWADIISIHASAKDKILGKEQFRFMRKGAWLINVSRGEVLDEEALFISLKNGRFSGAAIDVYEREPYNGPLQKLDNIILTPHVGSYAKETRVKMEIEAAENLIKGFKELNILR